jgi:hypothetical protein
MPPGAALGADLGAAGSAAWLDICADICGAACDGVRPPPAVRAAFAAGCPSETAWGRLVGLVL